MLRSENSEAFLQFRHERKGFAGILDQIRVALGLDAFGLMKWLLGQSFHL
jgi:hypothetical protein